MNRALALIARACRAMPAALDRAWLRWALAEIDPGHPDVPYIVRRLAELDGRRG